MENASEILIFQQLYESLLQKFAGELEEIFNRKINYYKLLINFIFKLELIL